MSLGLWPPLGMAIYTLLLAAFCGVTTLAQSSTTADTSTVTNLPVFGRSGDVNATYRLRGYEGCSANQIDQIKSGFSEMVIMVMGKGNIYTTYPAIDWNSAVAQDFWGPAERNLMYREHIQNNLNRLAAVTYQYYLNPFARSFHVRCDDPKNECNCVSGKDVVTAYTIQHDPHINFCGGYFGAQTLADALMGGDRNTAGEYFNQASIWAHELMHVQEIGHVVEGAPRAAIIDQSVRNWPQRKNQLAYGQLATKWIAQDPSGLYWEVVENADNYAYFVTLNYMQRALGYYLSDPQIQISPQYYQDTVGVNNVTLESESKDGDDNRCKWARETT